jgi:hypothetical protein
LAWGGNIEIVTKNGDDLTLLNVPTGMVIDWARVARVKAGATTATNLIGFV